MPPPPPPPPPHHRSVSAPFLISSLSAAAAFFSFILVFSVCFRKISRKRTVPTDLSKPPHRFSYSALRRATNSFSPSLLLGQGGSGSVYRATLPKNHAVAVKVMESGVSLQGEREFQNELLFASKLDSPQVITAIGFSSDRKHRTMVLIYELMPNGNLQDAVLHKKCPELKEWKKRFSIAIDIAKGIQYLHSLQPPVIHGDIKPSNILLDQYFSAKIADFGLSWVRIESDQNNNGAADPATKDNSTHGAVKIDIDSINGRGGTECGSVVEESESVSVATAGFEDFNFGVDQSPESTLTLQEMADGVAVALPEGNLDVESVGSAEKDDSRKDSVAGKQDNNLSGAGEGEDGGKVKDYVMQWIGMEVKQERPMRDWIDGGASSSVSAQESGKTIEKKKKKKNNKMHKRLEWWISMDDEKEEKVLKKETRRQPREWWKEEYCEELEKKKKRKKKKKDLEMGVSNACNSGGEDYWPRDADLYSEREKKKRRSGKSRGSKGSMDWFSGELFRGRHNSRGSFSGEIPMSGAISSTPSMRGTVCYVAPEYGGGAGDLSEKSDVYSFGVLLLVLIAGRRPLQVTNSPMREYQRANLIHWARQLARTGKLVDLVDQSVHSVDREQAVLCITVALLCLQKSPSRRPSMKEVVQMLTGESKAPQLPAEFSPSPPSHFPFRSKSHRKVR